MNKIEQLLRDSVLHTNYKKDRNNNKRIFKIDTSSINIDYMNKFIKNIQ